MKIDGATSDNKRERVLKNLAIVLADIGLSLKDVVKTTVYLKNMDDFKGMNQVYDNKCFKGISLAVRRSPSNRTRWMP